MEGPVPEQLHAVLSPRVLVTNVDPTPGGAAPFATTRVRLNLQRAPRN